MPDAVRLAGGVDFRQIGSQSNYNGCAKIDDYSRNKNYLRQWMRQDLQIFKKKNYLSAFVVN
jgi:hypothetical protein